MGSNSVARLFHLPPTTMQRSAVGSAESIVWFSSVVPMDGADLTGFTVKPCAWT